MLFFSANVCGILIAGVKIGAGLRSNSVFFHVATVCSFLPTQVRKNWKVGLVCEREQRERKMLLSTQSISN